MIPLFKVNMSPRAKELVGEVLDSGMVGEGPKVLEFENKLKELFHHSNVLALNSCTSALTLALRLFNIGSGLNVLTTPFTMVATNCAIKANYAKIHWGKIERKSLCLDLEQAERIIIRNMDSQDAIDAVMLVLVGGMVPEYLDSFYNFCKEYRIPLILDAAHALTTIYKGKHVSHYADVSCFSFQSIKHLTTADGGAIVCNNNREYQKAKDLRWFGITRDIPPGKTRLEHQMTYQIQEWGYKFHMNDVNAAIGLANLDIAQEAIKKSIENANFYMMEVSNSFQPIKDCQPSWWVYPIWVDNPLKTAQRLEEKGIITSPMWAMNWIHRCFPFQTFESFEDPGGPLFIPNGFWVDEEKRSFIVEEIKKS